MDKYLLIKLLENSFLRFELFKNVKSINLQQIGRPFAWLIRYDHIIVETSRDAYHGSQLYRIAQYATDLGRTDIIRCLFNRFTATGNKRIIRYLFNGIELSGAINKKHHDLVDYLVQEREYVIDFDSAISAAVTALDFNLLKFLKVDDNELMQQHGSTLVETAILNDQVDTLRYLFEDLKIPKAPELANLALIYDCTKCLHYLVKEHNYKISASMDFIAKNSLLGVEWLHNNTEHVDMGNKKFCTTNAIDKAAENSLEIVKFLNENRSEGCTVESLYNAIKAGKFEIVRYLVEHCNMSMEYNEQIFIYAINYRNIEFMRYLFERATRQPIADVSHRLLGLVIHMQDYRFAQEMIEYLWNLYGQQWLASDNAPIIINLSYSHKITEWLVEHGCQLEKGYQIDKGILQYTGVEDIAYYLTKQPNQESFEDIYTTVASFARFDLIEYLYTQNIGDIQHTDCPALQACIEKSISSNRLDVFNLLCSADYAKKYLQKSTFEAVKSNQVDVLKYLFESQQNGTDYNMYFMQASRDGHLSIAEFLIQKISENQTIRNNINYLKFLDIFILKIIAVSDDIRSLWDIDRSEVIKSIYKVSKDGAGSKVLVECPKYQVYNGFPPGEPEKYNPVLEDCFDRGGYFCVIRDPVSNRVLGAAVLDTKKIGVDNDLLTLVFFFIGVELRGKGFCVLSEAKQIDGVNGLYISAIPGKNTVDFYIAQGCKLIDTLDQELYEREPEDVHLILKF
ncbi:hypothetical protein PPL_12052 [Heterostelium album PN500]|uniref:Uncharacterized protein n=1 Tax=Heterostelium pallidum (strain ATCC 26659 / Pp 5 / PN500) TaxID=670386 RepID=D3BLJ9_HETP5|nr:hypothetical protein PPL_12052 [Heterostelium album PN500]EFA77450.1 hypothetical protein PPL_12052 [Heterostelium album PN500]|eukprot:XP_020429578.1 hypothetical protein PPL_12052 [Heterostelium album PN500]